ncbi:hypothetical protein ACQ4PT_051523 [Festuca glaucescens]
MGGRFVVCGNGRGRSRERYAKVPKAIDKSVVASGVVIPGTISDAEVTKEVAGAISDVGVQQETRVQPASNDAPMVVTMELVAPLVPSAGGSVVAASKASEKVSSKKNKKKEKNADKVKCFRCGNVGHYSIECTVPTCDFCESADHANADCPLHSAPKPVLIVYGYANEGLVFCDIQNSDSYRPRPDNGRVGRITVTGGTLTSDEIIRVLRGLVLDDQFPWAIEPQDNSTFKTQFPSKMELTRATRFGTFLAKEDSKCFVTVTEWKSEVKPTLLLDEVWVLINGVPEGLLRDYLALWGLCGMLGKTIAVDMAYTRRHEVVRAHVRVTDISMIPFHRIIMYKGEGYELSFEIEMDEEMLPADDGADEVHGDDGDHAGDDKGMDSNSKPEEDKGSGKSSEKKDKEPTTKAGVILRSSITETLLLTPAMKFGSFSDRWSDMVEAEETRKSMLNTCR